MRVLCLQHEDFEGPAAVADWIRDRGHSLSVHFCYGSASLPGLNSFDGLVIMGGTMNVDEHDKFPWLPGEITFIRQAIDAKKTVIGFCLGAQLIAKSLGAAVRRNRHREIGWFPVEITPDGRKTPIFDFLPPEFVTFHWHGDTFDLPPNVVHLARSQACENQAFLFSDRVLALQFHPEATKQGIDDLAGGCGSELRPGPFVQPVEQIVKASGQHLAANQAWLFEMLDRLPVSLSPRSA